MGKRQSHSNQRRCKSHRANAVGKKDPFCRLSDGSLEFEVGDRKCVD